MQTNPKIDLKLKRETLHNAVAQERYGGSFGSVDYSNLERVSGTYQIGSSKGSLEIVWQPSTGKFFETKIRSHASALDVLLGYVRGFGRQVEGEQSYQPGADEVLQAVCVDYLQIPIGTQAQDQLRGRRNLEGMTGRETREIQGRELRQLPSKDVNRLKP
mgnify:CR=1 FL=1